jgi:type II secretory pathway component GspD/PulD (secretin)
MAKLNLLESTSQADIVANPQLTSQDGSQAQLRSIQEEWFMMSEKTSGNNDFGFYSRAELQKIESGTVLTITPRVGDSNEITLEMAIEVSNSIPRGADSDLPIVTRRQTKNKVTILNGGTVAVAGLTENHTRQMEKKVPILGSIPILGRAFRNNDDQKATREIAVFVTATLLPQTPIAVGVQPTLPQMGPAIGSQPQPAGDDFANGLREALRRQSQ